MKRYYIEKYKKYPLVQLYTVRFEDNESETDAFISRFSQLSEYADDFNIIIYWINKIGESGVLERFFRLEERALAVPIDSGYCLRLYCYRVNDKILILGNGGVKSSQGVKDSPDCLPHFNLMNHVANKIYWSKQNGHLKVVNEELIGKLDYNYKKS